MKKSIIAVLLCCFISYGWSQHTDFKKTIENKYSIIALVSDKVGLQEVGRDNVASKSSWEKLIFGTTNAEIEFSVEPSFSGAYGLRLRKEVQDNPWVLGIARISNWDDVEKELKRKFPIVSLPIELTTSPYFKNIEKVITQYNIEMYEKRAKEREKLDLYEIQVTSIPVSERFAKNFYTKLATFIVNFKGGRLPAGRIQGDGEYTTFRGIMDEEVWTLQISPKTEGEAALLSNLCKRIIADSETGNFNETEYIKELTN